MIREVAFGNSLSCMADATVLSDVSRKRPLPPVLPQRIGEKRGLLGTLPSIIGLNP